MSNALLVARRRSTTGRPLFVAGPAARHLLPRTRLRGGHAWRRLDARGISIPARARTCSSDATRTSRGVSPPPTTTSSTSLSRRSATAATRSTCTRASAANDHVDAGVLKGNDADIPDQRLAWNETVHGPVTGYATVNGERVAIAHRRSTRGREVLSMRLFHDLNSKKVKSAKGFIKVANQLEHTFNVSVRGRDATSRCTRSAGCRSAPEERRSGPAPEGTATPSGAGSCRREAPAADQPVAGHSSTGTTSRRRLGRGDD